MKIYVTHSRDFDYENLLYRPIRESELNKLHDFILCYVDGQSFDTKETIKDADLVLAEVSVASTGQGVELGWAEILGTPILCIYQDGAKFSRSLKFITKDFISYLDGEDLIEKLGMFLGK